MESNDRLSARYLLWKCIATRVYAANAIHGTGILLAFNFELRRIDGHQTITPDSETTDPL